MASFVSAIQTRLKLEDATSAKDDVTPVFLIEEIVTLARSTREGGLSVLDFLVRNRLAASALGGTGSGSNAASAAARRKALKLVTAICSKGPSDFKREAARSASGAIRELTAFKGSPDPLLGDAPNSKVRAAAKEALEALYSVVAAAPTTTTSSSAQQGSVSSSSSSRIQGFGSNSTSSGNGAAASGGMIGFGNPRFEGANSKQSTTTTTASSFLAAASSAVASAVDAAAALAVEAGLAPPPAPSASALGSARHGPPGTPSPVKHYLHSDSNNNSSSFSLVRPPAAASSLAPLPEVAPRPPGVAEAAHVERLCAPGGLRSALSKAELERFVDGLSVSGLDGAEIARLLRAKLEGALSSSSNSAASQAAARAAAAVAAVVERGSTAAAGEIAVAFQSDPSTLRRALDEPSTHAGLRREARKALLALGEEAPALPEEGEGDESAAAAAAAARARAAAAAASSSSAAGATSTDLLGDLLSPSSSAPAPCAPSTSTSSPSGRADALADLMSSLTTKATTAATTADPFAPPPSVAAAVDPFSLGGAAPIAAPAAAMPELLGGGGVAAPQQQQLPPSRLAAAPLLGGAAMRPRGGASASAAPSPSSGLGGGTFDFVGEEVRTLRTQKK